MYIYIYIAIVYIFNSIYIYVYFSDSLIGYSKIWSTVPYSKIWSPCWLSSPISFIPLSYSISQRCWARLTKSLIWTHLPLLSQGSFTFLVSLEPHSRFLSPCFLYR